MISVHNDTGELCTSGAVQAVGSGERMLVGPSGWPAARVEGGTFLLRELIPAY